MKKWLVGLCAVLLMAQPVMASSKSLNEIRQERTSIQNSLRNTQNNLDSTRAEMGRVQLEILDLDETLTIAMEELEVIDNALDDLEARLEQTELDLEQAQEHRDNQYEALKARLRVMHEHGTVSFLEVLLDAGSIREFLARWEFVNAVAKSDQEILDRMQVAEERVAEKIEDISRQRNTIEALKFTQEAKMQELEQTIEVRGAYFKKLEDDEVLYEARLAQERETEAAVQAIYKQALDDEAARQAAARANMPAPNGEYLWPVPSSTRITSHYGNRRHPRSGKQEHHTGVDIGAKGGTNIVASHAGKVIAAGRQGSYGNLVIIDHGGGMSTLYAHASKVLVSVGQEVKRGDVIALIGSTGVSTGNHLHFEVRRNGNVLNPKGYLGY